MNQILLKTRFHLYISMKYYQINLKMIEEHFQIQFQNLNLNIVLILILPNYLINIKINLAKCRKM